VDTYNEDDNLTTVNTPSTTKSFVTLFQSKDLNQSTTKANRPKTSKGNKRV